jgi:hypothetical protein
VATVSAKLEEARAHLRRMEASSESQEQMLQILIRQRDHFENLAKRPSTKDVAVSPINVVRILKLILLLTFIPSWLNASPVVCYKIKNNYSKKHDLLSIYTLMLFNFFCIYCLCIFLSSLKIIVNVVY